jgi:curved DNA-binding protein CbpA
MTLSAAYEVLGLDPTSVTADVVHFAFRHLVLTNHPDLFQALNDKRRANEKMMELNEAYTTVRTAGFPRFARASEPPPSAETPPRGTGSRQAWSTNPQQAQRSNRQRSYADGWDVEVAARSWSTGAWHAPPDELDRAFERWWRNLGVAGLIARFILRIIDSIVQKVVIPYTIGIGLVILILLFLWLRIELDHLSRLY